MNQRVDLSREQWTAVRGLFDALAEAPHQERERVLAQSGEPAAVIAEAKALLAAADGAGDFMAIDANRLAGRPGPAAESHYQSLPVGAEIGSFAIVSLIGRGGQGEVYRAERREGGFDQIVALKLLRPEAAEQFDRFEYERQILADFEHPGIARLIDGGTAPDGRPYLAMEFVDGAPITRHCAVAGLTLAARLDLFDQICDAVAYAHRRLIVHRDLKPSNVLVTADGRVKLLDFGVAHALETAGQTLMTQVIFTPDYAAPEQFEGRNPTTATDVYALGAILFELLTGRPPWQLTESAFAGAMRVMRDAPPLPSRTAHDDAPVPPERLRGDLDIIVQKAMRHEPQERYQSASELADDIERYRKLEPIAARKGDRLYRVRRFLRRNRLPLIAAGLVLTVLGAGIVGVVLQMRRTEIARLGATAENERATALRDGFMLMLRAASQSGGPGFASARQVLDAAAGQLQREADGNAPLLSRTLAELYGEIGDPRAAVGLMQRYADGARAEGGLRRLAEANLALAAYHAQLGERDRAQAALRDAKAYFDSDPARHPKQLAELAGVEAALLREAGRRDEAMQRLRGAIAQLAALFGPDNGEIATLQHNLAVHALEAGDVDGAVKALDETERVLAVSGRSRSMVAIAALSLRAAVALRRGDAAGAERQWRQAVDWQRRDYGPSLALAAIELNLGRLIMAGSRFTEAMPILERALAVAAPLAGESNAVTIMLRQSRATGLMAEGKLPEARAEIESTLKSAQAAFGERHPYVGLALVAWSQILLAQGDPVGAKQALDASEAVLRAAGPAGAPHLAELGPTRELVDEALRTRAPAQP